MPLHQLQVHRFRNLRDVHIELGAGLQFVYGDNACGKTSLLDAAHVLCSAKSFLGASPRKLQQYHAAGFSVQGIAQQQDHAPRRLQYRWQDNHVRLFVSDEQVKRVSEYARLQPVRAVAPLSYHFLDDLPEGRRRFIDWGVFHMKHAYADIWRRFSKSLAQRNAMLGAGVDRDAMAAWNRQYARLANVLHEHRAAYIARLRPVIERFFHALLPGEDLQVGYYRGWERSRDLAELLGENFQRDLERRFTYYGPQRAELSVKLSGVAARDSASRGQKKLITFALYLAQASLQQDIGKYSSIFLVDDLPSELDRRHVGLVLQLLRDIPMQVFISCIDISQIPKPHRHADKMFHVKHGAVKEVIQ